MGESPRPGKEATEQASAAPGQLDQAERRRGEEKRVDQVEGMAAEGRGRPAKWRSLTLALRRWAGPQAVFGAGNNGGKKGLFSIACKLQVYQIAIVTRR